MNVLTRIVKLVLGLFLALVVLAVGLLYLAPGIHISSLKMVMNVMTGAGADTPDDTLLSQLEVAEGYHLSVYARGIANPRMLATDAEGRLLVSSPRSGEVIQLIDSNGDGAADTQRALLSGLRRPHGIALNGGFLYVAESHQVLRVGYDMASGEVGPSPELVVTGLTDDGNHWTKSITFDEEGMLYVAMGSTCNVCEEPDPRRATIMRYKADGSSGEIYASGLRNSVGLAFTPWSGELYATDNGRDLLGDDYPPCELNRIEQDGFYGWPYLNGDNDPDPDFGEMRKDLQSRAIIPAFNFPAHNAPLGIYFPKDRQRTALVALHGSWNRSTPDGYRVLRLRWQDSGEIQSEDFLWGFLRDEEVIGRPVDIAGDGEEGFFISDDYARVIYRVSPYSRKSAVSSVVDSPAASSPAVDSLKVDAALAAAGSEVYRQYACGECHDDSAATPLPLTGLSDKYDLQSLADYFLTPTPPMPNFGLDEQQRRQLAHYLMGEEM